MMLRREGDGALKVVGPALVHTLMRYGAYYKDKDHMHDVTLV